MAFLIYLDIDSPFRGSFLRVSFSFWSVCLYLACWGSLGGLGSLGVGSIDKLTGHSQCVSYGSFVS